MSRSVQQVSTLVRSDFTVYDALGAPVTGLVNVDFTKLLALNGANDVTVVTVTEITSGRYTATWTPGSTGEWYLLIRNATYNPEGWDENFDVTTDGNFSVNAIMDQTNGIETGYTFRQSMRLVSAVLCGKVSGGPASPVFRNMPDTADRVSSVCNASGDRLAVVLTP